MANCAEGDGATAMASRSFPFGASSFNAAASVIIVVSLCGGGCHAGRLIGAFDRISDKAGRFYVLDEGPQIFGARGAALGRAHGLLDFHEMAIHDPYLRMIHGIGHERLPD